MTTELNAIRSFIRERLQKYLPRDVTIEKIDDSSKLFSTGVLDSIAVLKLIDDLEQEYDIELEPEELTVERIDTIEVIAELALSKIGDD